MIILIALTLLSVAGSVSKQHVITLSLRIVGGSMTTIENYPSIVGILMIIDDDNMPHFCAGIILNKVSVLTVAHCLLAPDPTHYCIRVGSSMVNSGGRIYNLKNIIIHPDWSPESYDCDIAIMHTINTMSYSKYVQPAFIPGINYILNDNAIVWAVGWGNEYAPGLRSEQLRHVMIWTVDQVTCTKLYKSLTTITNDMLCSGWLDVGLRDQCLGDSGGPLYHLGIVVGLSSVGFKCGQAKYPGINTRLTSFTTWIQANSEGRINIWEKNKTIFTFLCMISYYV